MTTAKKKPTAASKAKAFEAFRNKAIARNEKLGRQRPQMATNEPFILGEELGFTPAIEINVPTLEAILVMENAIREGDSWTTLRALFGGENAVRVMSTVSDNYNAFEAAEIIEGIVFSVSEHFFGEGAGESGFTGLLS